MHGTELSLHETGRCPCGGSLVYRNTAWFCECGFDVTVEDLMIARIRAPLEEYCRRSYGRDVIKKLYKTWEQKKSQEKVAVAVEEPKKPKKLTREQAEAIKEAIEEKVAGCKDGWISPHAVGWIIDSMTEKD